ncbi:UDP-N-acetylglucosamine 1-carboxyvinyltransferase [Clostridium sp. MD294]|uniref:UDP-N-acetylglucosamine 1-carboxyvinyltransferase n=1 Tax=Clostridium sp. MD294 TaxID=97138 RepID=UPI0002CC6516|nr:UDP-N-acetylglucosamine 1-carboxyvinyltransferase [Clostridium sp. MD294]NDO45879.1 UDP-N-acetylglucosamine 1-carboxyvinyltransferase [Clostridium sp. MD294]USF30462.1 UDP-N-acetylglucosamine 1-carboxyvinyltransferase 1 [Clostridium sp. MD294]
MGKYRIEGGHALKGTVTVKGSKNGILPILAGVMLTEGETVLHNCPNISDVHFTLEMLKQLGCVVKKENRTVVINTKDCKNENIDSKSVQKMRSSILFMGALLGRFCKANIGYPGGCEIGMRPIDLHLKAFREMGIKIEEQKGILCCDGEKCIGTKINLDFPSVGATENCILLAVKSKGYTTIYNAACEPEIVELQTFLNQCGANIKGAGTKCIVIEGVKSLHGTEYHVSSDRIEAGTFLCGAAITKGEIELKNICADTMRQVLLRLGEAGCFIKEQKNSIYLKAPKKIKPVSKIHTGPYPDFPTDMQPQFMSILTLAEGTSIISETVFEARFKHISELCRMGADITVEGQTAVIKGVKSLKGAYVSGKDLRCGAALILAGLVAEGETVVENACYVQRGYEQIEKVLTSLGASIFLEE